MEVQLILGYTLRVVCYPESTGLPDPLVENNTNELLQNAINHYGIENFVFVVVEVFIEDVEVSKETNKPGTFY